MKKIIIILFIASLLLMPTTKTIPITGTFTPIQTEITISNPYPSNGSTDVEFNATLNITINDSDGDLMNITWYSNSTGSWQSFATGGLNTTSEYTYGFEEASELENWTTTGIRSSLATCVRTGTYSLEIEGASEYASHDLSLGDVTKMDISWWNYPTALEENQFLNLSFYNGTSWQLIRSVEGWQAGIENVYTHYYDELDTDTYVFNDNCKICWNVSAANSGDRYYLDDIEVTYGYKSSMSNGTYAATTNFSDYDTTYYWNVSVKDGTNVCNSDIFHFTTIQDTIPPAVTINFAGNPGDYGGPYFKPPYEADYTADDGYYTNASKQIEDWIYINLSVDGTVSEPDNVTLHWYNLSSGWTNSSYYFTKGGSTGEDNESYYTFNSSGVIPVSEGHWYSFDIWANDTLGNSKVMWWNKTDMNGNYARRTVQLDCTQTNISYNPLYFHNLSYEGNDGAILKADRWVHDQGIGSPYNDTGLMNFTVPGDAMTKRHCGIFIHFWYDEDVCVQADDLDNIYYHVWWTSDVEYGYLGNKKARGAPSSTSASDAELIYKNEARSNTTYDNNDADLNNTYYLETRLITTSETAGFTDNDAYEIRMVLTNQSGGVGQDPSIISNRSVLSFVIWNVPDNVTLQGLDNDSDGLTDYEELYVTYTNPFLADTDNDGANDSYENSTGHDPNNYTDVPAGLNNPPVLSNPGVANESREQHTTIIWNITINDSEGDLFNYTLECTNGQSDSGNNQANGSKASEFSGMDFNSQYTMYVNVTDDDANWTREWFTFYTNYTPYQQGENPLNGTTGVSTSLSTINVTILEYDGTTFNWTIATSPNIGSSNANDTTNGSKSCSISGLSGNTEYWWYVNVTDGATWSNESYNFTTTSTTGDIIVDDDADPGWYDATHVATIIEGIANASAGSTVYVWAGTYVENISINKRLSLIGNGRAVPTIYCPNGEIIANIV